MDSAHTGRYLFHLSARLSQHTDTVRSLHHSTGTGYSKTPILHLRTLPENAGGRRGVLPVPAFIPAPELLFIPPDEGAILGQPLLNTPGRIFVTGAGTDITRANEALERRSGMPVNISADMPVFKYPATLLAIMAGLSVLFLADRIRRLFRHPAK